MAVGRASCRRRHSWRLRPVGVVRRVEEQPARHIVHQHDVGGGDAALVEHFEGIGQLAVAGGDGRRRKIRLLRSARSKTSTVSAAISWLSSSSTPGHIFGVLVDHVILHRRLAVDAIRRGVNVGAGEPAIRRHFGEVEQRLAALCPG